MKQVLIIAITCLLFANAAHAVEQYLCTADRASGFSFNKVKKEWDHATFKANSKYVVSKPEDGGAAFVVREIGNSSVTAWQNPVQ